MKKQFGFTQKEVLFVVLVLFGVVGWIANIVKLVEIMTLVESNLAPLTRMVVLRSFGIVVPPLGAILGFL